MRCKKESDICSSRSLGFWIAGLGTQYPRHLLGPEKLDTFVRRLYDMKNPGIKKLLRIHRTTGIETRSSALDFETGWGTQRDSPSIAEMDNFFRTTGVSLAVQSCTKAIEDWDGKLGDITHTVAVTCSNQGCPGYDVLVNEQLGLSSSVDRTLLHGVGCAGGLAIMRTAAQIACGATMRGRPCMLPSIRTQNLLANLSITDFDWALHPGGQAIVDGVQEAMDLTNEQLRAMHEIYRTRGNFSSPTVLAVLDKLRYRRADKEFIIATAFGPGLSIEMSILRSCRLETSHTM